MSWTDRLPSRFRQLAYIGVTDDDPEDLRLDKAMLTLVSCLIALMSFLWVGVYLALGLPWSAAIPFVYQLCAVAILLSFARTKRIGTTRVMLLLLMTVLPFALQWSLGGFENGSAVAAWGGVTPILAYLFGAVGAVWLGAFIVLLGVSAAFESVLSEHAPAIGEGVRAAMFALNLAGPTLVAFFALWYFADQRNQARAALAEEHRHLVAEQERSERLLLNVLPAAIAEQLRDGSSTIAESHPDVSVLFADIVGFTPLGERLVGRTTGGPAQPDLRRHRRPGRRRRAREDQDDRRRLHGGGGSSGVPQLITSRRCSNSLSTCATRRQRCPPRTASR